jgi:hypothetical protein
MDILNRLVPSRKAQKQLWEPPCRALLNIHQALSRCNLQVTVTSGLSSLQFDSLSTEPEQAFLAAQALWSSQECQTMTE